MSIIASLDGTRHSKIDINGDSTSKVVLENIRWASEYVPVSILTVLNDTNIGTGEILELAKFVYKHNLGWSLNSDYFCMVGSDQADQMFVDIKKGERSIKLNEIVSVCLAAMVFMTGFPSVGPAAETDSGDGMNMFENQFDMHRA